METIFNSMQTIIAISTVVLMGIFAIFMGYAIVHMTNKNEEDEK